MLTSKAVTRVQLPDEPGAWIEVRLPSIGILSKADAASQIDGVSENYARSLYLMKACILAWSYPDEVTPENIEDLDGPSMSLVLGALFPSAGSEAEAEVEKKEG